MKTTVLKINNPLKDIEELKKAADCIDTGGLVVFPAETVYGIAYKLA
jgi:tRNA A37 threonylcarbamoyladenosine synthetase subunit TsaC/SUA5/YrdC